MNAHRGKTWLIAILPVAMVAAGVWLIVAGSRTYMAVIVRGHRTAAGPPRFDYVREVQVGQSTWQIVGGSLALSAVAVVGLMLVSRRTRVAVATAVSVDLAAGVWLPLAGFSTYDAFRFGGRVWPVLSAANARSLGLTPFAAGRDSGQVLAGTLLVALSIGAALFALRGRAAAR